MKITIYLTDRDIGIHVSKYIPTTHFSFFFTSILITSEKHVRILRNKPTYLSKRPSQLGELTPARYGLSVQDSYSSAHELVSGTSQGSLGTLEQIQNHLESIYCGSTAVDFSGIEVRIMLINP